MTEADLLSQLSSTGDFLWSLIQYWTSLSIALLIGAHLVAKRINGYILGGFLLIYIGFSLQLSGLINMQIEAIKAVILDLRVLEESGVGISNYAMAALKNSPLNNESPAFAVFRNVLGWAMLLMTIVYPVYCNLKPED